MKVPENGSRESLLTYLRWCDKKMGQQHTEIQELRDENVRLTQELEKSQQCLAQYLMDAIK